MVNAKKHQILKEINEVILPFKRAKQLANRREEYKKTKFKTNADMNLYKNGFKDLEHY